MIMQETLSQKDLDLLRRFEPIACFTLGEQFYPMNVDPYLAESALCIQRPNDVPEVLVPRGELTIDRLIEPRRDVDGSVYFINFAEALSPKQVIEFYRQSTVREFHAGRGRLARVGLLARLLDLLFSVTLLLRGKVPGGLAADAALRYQAIQEQKEEYTYYGRVVRENGYTILQYWFFYAFNDWRSSFYGVNDHESDWEMMTIYTIEDDDGAVHPCWVGYSSHEFEGDDLRRSWNDPELQLVGEHPVVYVGAGSHANYYAQGEYLPVAEVPFTRGIVRFWRRLQRFWRVTLRQGGEYIDLPDLSFIRIPFVDYARGDGLRIGPGENKTWKMIPLQATETSRAPAWVEGYRGLWGLYTRDPVAGEDAPAGPRYNRDGTVRKMWYNPLGWGGLDKVPPPTSARGVLERQQQRLRDEQQELKQQIVELTERLMGLEMEAEAVRGLAHLQERAMDLESKIAQQSQELNNLKSRRAMNELVLESCYSYGQRLASGSVGDMRAHLRLPQMPTSSAELRLGRIAETWSALSIGLLLIGIAIIAQFVRGWEMSLLALIGIYSFIEALFRRQVQFLVRYVVVGLAIAAGLVLLYTFFWPVVIILISLAGLLVIVENIRELTSSFRNK
jgi:hypothetical protein